MAEVGEDKASSSGEKGETRSSHATQPSEDRYIVDKFRPPASKSKKVPFESIDLSIYKPSAKCLAFLTSEKRLPLWIAALRYRYCEIIGKKAEYEVTWEEQNTEDSPSSKPKCGKISIHLTKKPSTGEETLVAITVFVTTGRIQVQGKKFEEWGKYEFPPLLDIVDNDDRQLPSVSSLTLTEDQPLYGTSLQNFFGSD